MITNKDYIDKKISIPVEEINAWFGRQGGLALKKKRGMGYFKELSRLGVEARLKKNKLSQKIDLVDKGA